MTNQSKYTFELPLQVRDYEVDAEGIVNNAEYLHYMEHTRHEFCKQAGYSFRRMQEDGLSPVVTKIEIEYKKSLGLGDDMRSCLNISRRGPLYIFQQDIYTPDGEAVTKARVSIACLRNGLLTRGDELSEAFAKYLTV
ncbi:MAG: acyl-CoA thioesterase [Muribaculaceae bacterium]|nr:acyl-CoA thioesterase [Muribaculaceae bacterium]MDE6693910.1 acyl-CoA thioesterase [Muribaculaceae bacterium]